MGTTSRARRSVKAESVKDPVLFAGLEGEFLGADDVVVMPKSIKSWRAELDQAIADDTSSAKRLLDVVKLARTEGYDVDTVREHVSDAFKCAGCSEATCRQRAADAAVIVDYPLAAFEKTVGGSVQVFAANLRKLAKEMGLVQGRKRGAKTPEGEPGEASVGEEVISESRVDTDDKGVAALATTRRALEQLANRAGSNALALDIIANIRDLLDDVADAMLGVEVVTPTEQSA